MQGTGTNTDPYLIETWDDFFDMSNDTSTAVHYMLANDLDGNDYNGGIFPLRKTVHGNLDGNGHTIRNIYNMDGTGTAAYYLMIPIHYNGTWKNLTFENVLTNVSFWGYNQSNATRTHYFENVKFSGKCYAISHQMHLYCTECAISCELIEHMCNFGITLQRSSLKGSVSIPSGYAMHWTLLSARLELEIKGQPSSYDSNKTASASNSVIAVKMPDGVSLTYTINGDPTSPSVLDYTLWGSTPTSNIKAGIIMLPTEDMKNADALNAEGFPVVRVS